MASYSSTANITRIVWRHSFPYVLSSCEPSADGHGFLLGFNRFGEQHVHVEASPKLLINKMQDVGDILTRVLLPNLEVGDPRQRWLLCPHGNGMTCRKCASLFQAAAGNLRVSNRRICSKHSSSKTVLFRPGKQMTCCVTLLVMGLCAGRSANDCRYHWYVTNVAQQM